jgi:hypothetical protein
MRFAQVEQVALTIARAAQVIKRMAALAAGTAAEGEPVDVNAMLRGMISLLSLLAGPKIELKLRLTAEPSRGPV